MYYLMVENQSLCHSCLLCKYFILKNWKIQLGKFDPKSNKGFFLGHSFVGKAYRVFYTRTLVVEETTHVIFYESDKYGEPIL